MGSKYSQILICILLLVTIAGCETIHSAKDISQSVFHIACSPDKPMVFDGETVRVRVWTSPSTVKGLQYTWSATGGAIDAKGADADWRFAGTRPGTHLLTVQVRDTTDEVTECKVQVLVQTTQQDRGVVHKTGRSFLVSGRSETKGYGLYSYLLLDSRPDFETRKRYLRAIIEYLRFTDISLFETAGISRNKLNITYLPIDTRPETAILTKLSKKDLQEQDLIPIAEWVLQHYDYVRAGILIDNLPGSRRNGPYIVSLRKPYDWENEVAPPYLYQDQSWVPPHLVSEWINVFMNQAAQERYWDEDAGENMVLKLRTIIGVLAAGVPDVKRSLTDWIKWLSDIS